MKRQALSLQLGFDLVFDVAVRDDDAAEVTGGAAPFAAPHLDRHCTAQRGQGQACPTWFLLERSPIRRRRSVHPRLTPLADSRGRLRAPSLTDHYASAHGVEQAPIANYCSWETAPTYVQGGRSTDANRRRRMCPISLAREAVSANLAAVRTKKKRLSGFWNVARRSSRLQVESGRVSVTATPRLCPCWGGRACKTGAAVGAGSCPPSQGRPSQRMPGSPAVT
jgi:hypothetical protein